MCCQSSVIIDYIDKVIINIFIFCPVITTKVGQPLQCALLFVFSNIPVCQQCIILELIFFGFVIVNKTTEIQ